MKLPEPGDATASPPSPAPQLHPDSQPGLQTAPPAWTIEDAEELYLIDRWGAGHFGDLARRQDDRRAARRTRRDGRRSCDVVEAAIRDEGLKAPLIIRFQDMLHHRVRVLNEAFAKAIEENKFRGTVPRRVPDQGEPAPRGRGGDRRGRAPVPLRHRGRLQARDVRRPRRAHRQRVAHHLQRLQGRRVHPHGAARPQARQEGHPHRREALRGPRDRAHRRGDGRRAR